MKMCGMCDGNYVVELWKFVARSLEQRNKHEIRFSKIHVLMINEFDLPGTKGRGLVTYIPKHRWNHKKLCREKWRWKRRKFSFCICVTCHKCLKQRQKRSTYLGLLHRTRILSSMLLFSRFSFRTVSLERVEICLYDRASRTFMWTKSGKETSDSWTKFEISKRVESQKFLGVTFDRSDR